MTRRFCLALLIALATTAVAADAGELVELTATETAGVKRSAEPVTFGVPIPKGVLKSIDELGLQTKNAEGEVQAEVTDEIPVAFSVINR